MKKCKYTLNVVIAIVRANTKIIRQDSRYVNICIPWTFTFSWNTWKISALSSRMSPSKLQKRKKNLRCRVHLIIGRKIIWQLASLLRFRGPTFVFPRFLSLGKILNSKFQSGLQICLHFCSRFRRTLDACRLHGARHQETFTELYFLLSSQDWKCRCRKARVTSCLSGNTSVSTRYKKIFRNDFTV